MKKGAAAAVGGSKPRKSSSGGAAAAAGGGGGGPAGREEKPSGQRLVGQMIEMYQPDKQVYVKGTVQVGGLWAPRCMGQGVWGPHALQGARIKGTVQVGVMQQHACMWVCMPALHSCAMKHGQTQSAFCRGASYGGLAVQPLSEA